MSSEPRVAALKVGPHATGIAEPRQARKGATVRRPSRVPWEYLTGAGYAGRSRYGPFGRGCTVTIEVGGPDMAPHPPNARQRPGKAVALLDNRSGMTHQHPVAA